MSDSDTGYGFGTGIGDDQIARLEFQGAVAAPATRMIFTEAGHPVRLALGGRSTVEIPPQLGQ
jgi:hypothetical protein